MAADPRVDYYLVNSPIIKRRLWKYYKREPEVLHPPVELDQYHSEGNHRLFFHLGQIDKCKDVPEIVAAFKKLDEQLTTAGGIGDVGDSVIEETERAENIEWRGSVDEEGKSCSLDQSSWRGRLKTVGEITIITD